MLKMKNVYSFLYFGWFFNSIRNSIASPTMSQGAVDIRESLLDKESNLSSTRDFTTNSTIPQEMVDMTESMLNKESDSSPTRDATASPTISQGTDDTLESPPDKESPDLSPISISQSRPSLLRTSLSFAWNRLSTFTLQALVLYDSFCKDVYSEADAEKLFNIAQKFGDNWWRERDAWFYHKELQWLICSSTPNAGVPLQYKISDDEFFQARKINIPIRLGRKGTRLNKYQFLNLAPTWRTMLECDCQIIGEIENADNICVNGKNVNLSKGVGGDSSFFIHAPDSTGSYKVVAHICFG